MVGVGLGLCYVFEFSVCCLGGRLSSKSGFGFGNRVFLELFVMVDLILVIRIEVGG